MKGMAFSAEMAQAIYEGRKTQTRRVIKPQPDKNTVTLNGKPLMIDRYSIGERLFVQEPWRFDDLNGEEWTVRVEYKNGHLAPPVNFAQNKKQWRGYGQKAQKLLKASGLQPDEKGCYFWEPGQSPLPWHPVKSMPQWAARSIIEITNIRVERLQDISLGDVRREGVQCYFGPSHAFRLFATIWYCLYQRHPIKGWDANPWVWVIEFKRVEELT